jgi:hypothetical protein
MRFNPLRLLIPAALLVGCAAVFSAGGSAAPQSGGPAAPSGLQTFLQTADTARVASAVAAVPTYSRTPAFAWSPVRGATHYQFQLSTRGDFLADNAIVWSGETSSPAVSVPLALPWITGDPASLYWRVRAFGPQGVSQWSKPNAFVMRWTQEPRPLAAGPGYVRWSTVDGATAYQVWFLNARGHKGPIALGKVLTTITNVADEREYYLPGKVAPKDVQWRVRAVRRVYGGRANGLPAVSFGPWSRIFTSSLSPATGATGAFHPVKAVSDAVSTPGHPKDHSLVPAVTVEGALPTPATLYRVYVYTDRDCVNRVFTGYPVASPAYAPRSAGGAVLHKGTSRMADGTTVTPNELGKGEPAKVDLWDNLGRYYAVAVPVLEKVSSSKQYTYQDVQLPQDLCQAGRFLTFGKSASTPLVTADGHPSATGLSPDGRLLAAASWKPSFYGSPLVTWHPASGAAGYEVQWSKTAYPWQTAGSIHTAATAAMLPLTPGAWWYRVRGINPSLPGNGLMTWSAQVPLQITPPTFSLVTR